VVIGIVFQLTRFSLNNEGWFEWEFYHHLLKIENGWSKQNQKNRKGKNRKPGGDGVDLQFSNSESRL